MATIKEMTNVARRICSAVDSSTATIETESTKIRDDYTRGFDMAETMEFVSAETMTKCMAMVEERGKHALRIFTDVLKTPGGRSAASTYQQTLRRDASLKTPLLSATRGAGSFGGGGGFGGDSSLLPPPSIDVGKILMEASRVRSLC